MRSGREEPTADDTTPSDEADTSTTARAHHLQHILGACYGALALGMVLATVLGIWLNSPGGPVVLPDPDALLRNGCAAPMSDDEETDYIGVRCDDPEATLLVLDVVSPVEPPGRPGCPFGTDQILPIYSPPLLEAASPPEDEEEVEEEEEEPEVTGILCARNLYPPHPGDPGAGGGLLVAGDCAALTEDDEVVETPCDGSGDHAAQLKVLAIVTNPDDCPDGTIEGQEATGAIFPMWKDLEPGDPGFEAICTRPNRDVVVE